MQLALVRGGTGACNAVNTALTTDAQLQAVGESLSGALGWGKLSSLATARLKASPFVCWGFRAGVALTWPLWLWEQPFSLAASLSLSEHVPQRCF